MQKKEGGGEEGRARRAGHAHTAVVAVGIVLVVARDEFAFYCTQVESTGSSSGRLGAGSRLRRERAYMYLSAQEHFAGAPSWCGCSPSDQLGGGLRSSP